MKKIKVIILFLLLSFLFGCANNKDINQLLFVSALGIDKTEEGCQLVAQIVNKNILVQNPPDETAVFVVTSEGKTISDSLKNLNNALPSRPYLINLQLLVFGEEIAKEGIADYLHFFINYSEAQHEYNVLIVKGVSVEALLGQLSVFSMYPTRVLINKLKTASHEYGSAKETYISELISGVKGQGYNLVISSVEVEGDLEKGSSTEENKTTEIVSKIFISEMAVFEKDKLIGWLDQKESQAYNFVMGNIEKALLTVTGQNDNNISSVIENASGRVRVDVIAGIPKAFINVTFNASVIEDSNLLLPISDEYTKYVRSQLESKITENINKCIEKSKNELNLDLFSFSEKFYKFKPNWWRKNKDNYKEIYQDMDIEVKVNVTIKRLEI